MKILQLCKKFPFPLKDGESIAVTSLSRSLQELGCEITLLAMNTRKHFFDVDHLPSDFNHYQEVHTVELDNRIKPVDAFLNLFSKESYHISRFVSLDFKNKLIRLLREEDYDIVQLETLYLAPYIPYIRQYSDAIIAMRAHNVEHEIWDRITENTGFKPKQWYLKHLTKKLRRYEMEQLKNYDILVPITNRDQNTFNSFGYRKPAVVTPIGIDTETYKPDYGSYQKELSISFIGSLDWMPNQEGLSWFLDKTWHKASKNFPELQLHIAGRNTPDWMFQMNKNNIHVHGEVGDAVEFINKHSIMVVPLLSGSGMRAKILEGMALGKVVISTSLGLEGIPAKHKSEVILADTPAEFIEGIRFCYEKKNKLEKIGRRAQEFVHQNFHSREIARNLIKAYSDLTVGAI